MKQPATLSVCMIVRDEAHQLEEALSCFKSFADEIIVVDTGSVDGTKEIARRFTSSVYDFPWCNDFSAARNASLEKATKDYILWLDADDRVDASNQWKMRQLKAYFDGNRAFYLVLQDKRTNGPSYSLYQLRCVPNRKNVRFQGRIHERLDLSVTACGLESANTDVVIHHCGYMDAALLNTKIRRNLDLLQEEVAGGRDDEQIHFYLALSHGHLGQSHDAIQAMKKSLLHLERQERHGGSNVEAASQPSPFLAEAHLFLAERFMDLGDGVNALRHTAQAGALVPDGAYNLFRLGGLYQRLQRHDQALSCLGRAYHSKPDVSLIPTPSLSTGALLVQMGYSFMCQGKHDMAEQCLREAGKEGIVAGEGWEQIGLSALTARQLPLALHAYESALKEGPLQADGYSNLGLLYSKKNDPEKSRVCYHRALEKDPGHLDALTNLAHLEFRAGHLPSAEGHYRKLLEMGRSTLDVLLALGVICLEDRDREGLAAVERMARESVASHWAESLSRHDFFRRLSSELRRQEKNELASWAMKLAGHEARTSPVNR